MKVSVIIPFRNKVPIVEKCIESVKRQDYKNAEIIADCAEPKSIDELCLAGWNVHPSVKGADSVRNGIMRMQAMTIYVVKGSTNLVKELATYSWKKDKDGKSLPEPQDMFNHALDAVRYRLNLSSRLVTAGSDKLRGALGL